MADILESESAPTYYVRLRQQSMTWQATGWFCCSNVLLVGYIIGISAPITVRPQFGFSSSSERIEKRVGARCWYKLSCVVLLPRQTPLTTHRLLRAPLQKRLLLVLAGEPYPFSFFFWKSLVFANFRFCRPFLNMYEHVADEHLPRTQHSNAPSTVHKTADQVRADQSTTTQASRQGWRELSYTARCKTSEEIEICTASIYSHSQFS